MIKTIGLLRARPGIRREEFEKHWLEVHGPLSHPVPGIRRYVQNHIVRERQLATLPAIDAQIDGIVEMWYDSWDDFRRASESPEIQALHADGATFIGGFKGFVVEEKNIR